MELSKFIHVPRTHFQMKEAKLSIYTLQIKETKFTGHVQVVDTENSSWFLYISSNHFLVP